MFKEITNYKYTRNNTEAVGFYLAYLLFGFMVGAIIGGLSSMVAGATTFQEGLEVGLKVGPVSAVVYVGLISFLVAKEKRLFKNIAYTILLLAGIILSIFGGSLLGLIIPAYLTTKQNN
jgi:uncharacterized membrane protein YoaK (UPF0700 family)